MPSSDRGEPGETLGYYAGDGRVTWRVLRNAVVLYLWAIVDLAGGGMCTLAGLMLCPTAALFDAGGTMGLMGMVLLLAGGILLCWSPVPAVCAYQLHTRQEGADARAYDRCKNAELFTYLAAGCVTCVMVLGTMHSRDVIIWPLLCLWAVALPPLALTRWWLTPAETQAAPPA